MLVTSYPCSERFADAHTVTAHRESSRGTTSRTIAISTMMLSRSSCLIRAKSTSSLVRSNRRWTTTDATQETKKKKKGWWHSAELWGGAGALAGWGMSGSASCVCSLRISYSLCFTSFALIPLNAFIVCFVLACCSLRRLPTRP
jgi:hypothetical protein